MAHRRKRSTFRRRRGAPSPNSYAATFTVAGGRGQPRYVTTSVLNHVNRGSGPGVARAVAREAARAAAGPRRNGDHS